MPPAKENILPTIFLGASHIFIGISILVVSLVFRIDLIAEFSKLSAIVPMWTLALAGLAEGFYWIGGIVPGTTYMFVYVLGQECTLEATINATFLIWLGVAGGIALTYASAAMMGKKGEVLEEKQSFHKFISLFPFGLHPTAAAAYMFEAGFRRKRFLPAFLPVIASGALVLVITVPLICNSGNLVEENTTEFAYVIAIGLIAWGLWKIWRVVSRSLIRTE